MRRFSVSEVKVPSVSDILCTIPLMPEHPIYWLETLRRCPVYHNEACEDPIQLNRCCFIKDKAQ